MYRNHFGLHDKPFRVVPSPKFLFASETHDEGRARMLYGIRENRGFVVVTGSIGLGKTTVLLSVLEELEPSFRTALIFNPVDTFDQLLRMVAFEFGLSVESTDEAGLMRELNLFLVGSLAKGESCVLLIDEAQNLSLELLEKIRLLSNLQTEEASLLQIVLVGQPELKDRLQDPRLAQLRQRVGVWHEIAPLDREETEDYIQHRLRLAGARRPKELIPLDVCQRVQTLSGGTPRLINQICDTALVIAYGRNAEQVETLHVEEAVRELQLEGIQDTRPRGHRRPAVEAPRRPARRPRVSRRALALSVGVAVIVGVLSLVYLGGKGGMGSLGVLDALEPESLQEAALGTDAQAEVGSSVPGAADADVDGIEPGPAAGDQASLSAASAAPEVVDIPQEVADPQEADVEDTPPPVWVAKMVARRDNVESWRAEGRVVYSVHLASFPDAAEARDFALDLVASRGDWDYPLYVETSGDNPVWYRVLGGGFPSRNEARAWTRRLKGELGISYAQVARLAQSARFLSLSPDDVETADTGVRG